MNLRDSVPGTAPSSEFVDLLTRTLHRMNRQIQESPVPAGEWPRVTATLGEEKTALLVGVSVSSVRRYASGERVTPQKIAERLHYLALVLADLAGSYNDFGMRRWFDRPRSLLHDRAPSALLGDFEPDSTDAQAVAKLAADLVSLGAV